MFHFNNNAQQQQHSSLQQKPRWPSQQPLLQQVNEYLSSERQSENESMQNKLSAKTSQIEVRPSSDPLLINALIQVILTFLNYKLIY